MIRFINKKWILWVLRHSVNDRAKRHTINYFNKCPMIWSRSMIKATYNLNKDLMENNGLWDKIAVLYPFGLSPNKHQSL